MIATQPICDQLKAAGYAIAEGLFEFAQLTAPPRNRPACFVIMERERAEGQPRVGAYDQKLTLTFSVVIVMDAPGRQFGGVSEELKAEISRVKTALFGWKHPEAASGCMLSGGRLLDLDAQTLSWAVEFTCTYRERKI